MSKGQDKRMSIVMCKGQERRKRNIARVSEMDRRDGGRMLQCVRDTFI